MLRNHTITFAVTSIACGLTALMSPLTPSVRAATFTGNTIGAPTWNRPVENAMNPPTAIAGNVGTAVPYNTLPFTVSAPGSYTFLSVTPSFDNYTFLYQNAFDPTNPIANGIVSNDDLTPNVTNGLSGFTTALNVGTNYFFVTTGFDNTDAGAFTTTITGTGNVSQTTPTSVPEPATILGSLAAFSYGIYARRKIKLARSLDRKTF
jgi:hypothetical protein